MATPRPAPSAPTRAYLQGLDKAALVALILEHADGPSAPIWSYRPPA